MKISGSRPSLWIFAGPNGAGKSSLVRRYRVAERLELVNPDDIAKCLREGGFLLQNKENEGSIQLEAGRRAVERRKNLLRQKRSFGVETTLTGHSELTLMAKAHRCDYRVSLVYIGLASADQSNSRVMARVRRGGHDVAEVDVYRRFDRSLSHLAAAVRLSDRVRILDNSDERWRLVLKMDGGRVRFVHPFVPRWVDGVITDMLHP